MTDNEIARGGRTSLEIINTEHRMWGVEGTGDTSGFDTFKRTVTLSPPAVRPYGSWYDEVVDILIELITIAGHNPDDVIEKVVIDRGDLILFIAREHSPMVAKMLRDDQDLRFELCLGTSAVHYPADKGRELHSFTSLFSITHNRKIAIEVVAPDADPHMPTLVGVYPGNDWHEREAWDLMGIVFDDHPGLTRTAMPDDWIGHPQRKDYPLGGIPVEYKGAVVPPPDTRRSYN